MSKHRKNDYFPAVTHSIHHHHHQKAFRNKSHTSHGHRPGLKRNKSKGKRLTINYDLIRAPAIAGPPPRLAEAGVGPRVVEGGCQPVLAGGQSVLVETNLLSFSLVLVLACSF